MPRKTERVSRSTCRHTCGPFSAKSSRKERNLKDSYNVFGKTLKVHLVKPTTITSPKASELLVLLKHEENGFDILVSLIYDLSPQLDGCTLDHTESIYKLTIRPGTTLFEFHTKACDLFYEINLQKDDTGAAMKLIQQYISQLRLIKEFDVTMIPHQNKLQRHIKSNGCVKNPYKMKYLYDFYDELKFNYSLDSITLEPDPNQMKSSPVVTTNEKVIFAAACLTQSQFKKMNLSSSPSKSSLRQTQRYSSSNPTKQKRCPVCGHTNTELHKILNQIHPCEDDHCIFRGPLFNTSKHMREHLEQYNVKHGDKILNTKNLIDASTTLPQNPSFPSKVSFLSDTKPPGTAGPEDKNDIATSDCSDDVFYATTDAPVDTIPVDPDTVNSETVDPDVDPEVDPDLYVPIVSALSHQDTNSNDDKTDFNHLSSQHSQISTPEEIYKLYL